jgi:peptidyl-prolyl cis-trans isomerase B (cyclophilin B)
MRLTLALPALLLVATVILSGCSGSHAVGAASCNGLTRASLPNVPANHTLVALATSKGCIVAELYDDKAPITAANFVNYTKDGFYNQTLIHRISKNFVLQAGGTGVDGEHKDATYPPITNEAGTSGLHNVQYSFSMARNKDPNSATSEFFINVKDNSDCLDAVTGRCDPTHNGYAVFAQVVQGQKVVDAIHALPVTKSEAHGYCISLEDGQGGSCPVDPVEIFSAVVLP